MKDIFTTIGKVLGWCFAATVILYTSLLTWQLAGRIVPSNPVAQAMTLVLFDVAALVWAIQFITQARGTLQWALSAIGFLVGLAGAIIMAGGELVLGQQLVQIEDPTQIGWVLLSTVVVAALAHATLTYFFHATDPAVKNRIENAQEVSKAVERAYADARSEITRNVDSLVAACATRCSTRPNARSPHRPPCTSATGTGWKPRPTRCCVAGKSSKPKRRTLPPANRASAGRGKSTRKPKAGNLPLLSPPSTRPWRSSKAEQPAPIHGKNGHKPEGEPPVTYSAETAGLPPLPPAPTAGNE